MNEGCCSIAPLRGKRTIEKPWEGGCFTKPWDFEVTAAIPVLDTADTVEIAIELLRLQSVRPFIIIIDTGSQGEHFKRIQELAAEDVEIHSLRLNGVMHPSDFPAMAMDVAFAVCRTDFMFATHADVFLRNRHFLEELIEMAKNVSPVVGYEMSPRAHSDWKGMVSHTATMFHMPSMDKIGFGWSQRRLCNIYNVKCYRPDPMRPNWPDTEILGNYILRKNKIQPHLIGKESNFSRQVDDNIDHCRSITAGRLYSPSYEARAEAWLKEAKEEALERIESWKQEREYYLSRQMEVESEKKKRDNKKMLVY